ncbi:MAG: HNH endonuclease [Wohlfahrtiimonas sp.]
MRECIYCRTTKPVSDFSLEHVIPQFLGGNLTPDFLKTRDVCAKCNNNLGLFVDANFSKNWLIFNEINTLYSYFYSNESCTAHPLIYMGILDLKFPHLQDNEMCELWLGPNGDRVFWIKKKDDRFSTYSGNNPITARSLPSRCYNYFSESMAESEKKLATSIISFKKFFKSKNTKKITCTTLQLIDENNNTVKIPYDEPDYIDQERISFIRNLSSNDNQAKLSLDINCSYRFLAKLAIGISYCLLGKAGLTNTYSDELYKAINFREGDAEANISGISNISENPLPNDLKILFTNPGAITVIISIIFDSLTLHLNIGNQHWTFKLASLNDIKNIQKLPECLQGYGNGFVLIIYPAINKAIYREFAQYIQYKVGGTDPELDAINEQMIR